MGFFQKITFFDLSNGALWYFLVKIPYKKSKCKLIELWFFIHVTNMQSNKSKSVLNQFWRQTELGMLTCDRMINDNKSHMLHYSMVLFIFTTIFFSEVSLYAKRYLMQNHILHYLFRYLSLEVDNAFTLYLTFEKWNTKNISKRFHVLNTPLLNVSFLQDTR